MIWLRICIGLVVVFGVLCAKVADVHATDGQLVKVVIVTRHGVRAPLTSPDELDLWSASSWPDLRRDWGVDHPGDLTPRGAALVRLMGQYYRVLLVSDNLLQPLQQCPPPDDVSIWADVDARTLDTGKALIDGLAPGCGIRVNTATTRVDPMFHPVKAGVCAFDRARTEAAILGRIGGSLDALQQADRAALATLQSILRCCKPMLCRQFVHKDACTLSDLGSGLRWRESKDGSAGGHATVALEGTLGIASTAAEILLLEYANGFGGSQWGFGRTTRDTMLEVARLHALDFELMARTPYVAAREGSELLRQLLGALRSAVVPPPEQGVAPKQAKVVVFVGHDTNIANLAALLDVSWQQRGYHMNETPPAGALVFEVRRGRDDELRVYASYLAQSPEQMALQQRLDLAHPPQRSALFVPACSSPEPGYPCALNRFYAALSARLDRQCVLRPGGSD